MLITSSHAGRLFPYLKVCKRLALQVALSLFFTMIVYAQSNPISGRITNANGAPMQGVNITVKGKSAGATTNANGDFTINASNGDILVISNIGFRSLEVKVTGNQPVQVALESAITELTTVVVGSRSLRPRTTIESPVPVDVINSKDLMATGQIEPTQQLAFNAPSFSSNRQTVSDGTDHIDPASLRSLGPDQVLVLVNGKRRYNTALVNINGTVGKGSVGTDLNAIPTSAIERIEVLRDGAASQYGSDAIAGVINVVLKKQTGTHVFAHAGQHFAGDGGTLQLGINQGWKLGKRGGILNATVEFRDRARTNRAGDFLGTVYTSDVAKDEDTIAQRGFSRKDNMFIGSAKQMNVYGELNLELPLNANNTRFYATAMYSHRNGEAAGLYRYPKQALTGQVVRALYPDGFLPLIETTIGDKSVIAGIKGKTRSAWNWDVSSVFGGNSFQFEVSNSNNASMGTNSPREFDCGKISFHQSTTNVDFSKDFGSKMNLNSFNVAIGAELRFDQYKIEAGQEESWKKYDQGGLAGGAQVFPGFQPTNEVDESRSIVSTYVDLESDITDKFLVNIAGRFERYSDFGTALAGKLALRYKLTDWIAIRGAVSNGFRAPSMHQYFFSNISSIFTVTNTGLVQNNTLTVRNNDQIAKALGIPELKEETSVNYSLGLTTQLGKRVSLTVDAYQIKIDNRIVLAGPFRRDSAIVDQALTDGGISRDVRVVQAFSNIIDTKTQGLDVILTMNPKTRKGDLDITLAANFNKTTIEEVNGTEKIPAVPNATGNYFFFDRIEQSRILHGNPKSKISLGVAYQLKKIGANVRVTHFGEVSFWNTNPNLDETYEARAVTDASINYFIIPAVRVTIGANNIFDVYPQKLKWFREANGDTGNRYYANTGEGRFVYSRNATQFGMNGGYYYITVGLNL
jgi:iron complex outermembrane receptor protein